MICISIAGSFTVRNSEASKKRDLIRGVLLMKDVRSSDLFIYEHFVQGRKAQSRYRLDKAEAKAALSARVRQRRLGKAKKPDHERRKVLGKFPQISKMYLHTQ